MIKLSVIIPTYNRANLVLEAIHSILDQNLPDVEIIVVDDGSTDDTAEKIIQLNSRSIRYCYIENSERGRARNKGFTLAAGEYVTYFDSDDLYHHCIADLIDFIFRNGKPPVVFGQIEPTLQPAMQKGTPSNFKSAIIANNFLACGSVIIRRDVAAQFPFSADRNLSGTEDWEAWLRLYATHDFLEYKKVLFRQRQHAGRSLAEKDPYRVETRELAFVDALHHATPVLRKRFSRRDIALLLADRYTLVALAFVVAGKNSIAFRYLLKAITTSVRVLSRKRPWAVVKHLWL